MALITSDPRLSTGPAWRAWDRESGGSGVLRLLVPPAPPGASFGSVPTAHVDGRRAGAGGGFAAADRVRARGRDVSASTRSAPSAGARPRPRVHGVALGPPTRRAGGHRSPAAGRCRSPRPDMAPGSRRLRRRNLRLRRGVAPGRRGVAGQRGGGAVDLLGQRALRAGQRPAQRPISGCSAMRACRLRGFRPGRFPAGPAIVAVVRAGPSFRFRQTSRRSPMAPSHHRPAGPLPAAGIVIAVLFRLRSVGPGVLSPPESGGRDARAGQACVRCQHCRLVAAERAGPGGRPEHRLRVRRHGTQPDAVRGARALRGVPGRRRQGRHPRAGERAGAPAGVCALPALWARADAVDGQARARHRPDGHTRQQHRDPRAGGEHRTDDASPASIRSSAIPNPPGVRGTLQCPFWGIGRAECRRRADSLAPHSAGAICSSGR